MDASEIINGMVWESCFPNLWPQAKQGDVEARQDVMFGVFFCLAE